MADIPTELIEPVNQVWRHGATVGFIVGAILGGFLVMCFFCVLERPLKFKSAPGFRQRNALYGNAPALTHEQVAQLATAKALLRSHGYRI